MDMVGMVGIADMAHMAGIEDIVGIACMVAAVCRRLFALRRACLLL